MAKRIDLTGKQFNEWSVIEYAGNRQWLCKCSCGKITEVDGMRLRHGKSKSCGHGTTSFKDMVGEVFGEWTVVSYDDRGYWNCRCSCGVTRSVSGFHLRAGRTNSCGHGRSGFVGKEYIKKNSKQMDSVKDVCVGSVIGEWEVIERQENSYWLCECSCGKRALVHDWQLKIGRSKSCGHSQLEDIKGNNYGNWTVLKYVGKSYWECKCSCGEIRNVRKTDLLTGKSVSCGHDKSKPKIDLSGHKFGMLEVLNYMGGRKYKCVCDCGNIKEILGTNLMNGGTVSCGCKHISKYTEQFMNDVIDEYERITGELPFVSDLAEILELNEGYVNNLLHKHKIVHRINRAFRSRYEREICKYIKEMDSDIDIITSDRKILNGNELDIYIPSRQFAIEFNGDYWHSDINKDKRYHQKKTIECAKKGIQLLHIFEYEWNKDNTKDKIKELIKGKILGGGINREYARKCEVRQVNKEEEKRFLDDNHLQGRSNSSIAYGLYNHTDELISIMTFGKPRFNSNYDLELIRYCTKQGVGIVGGAEKIFKHAVSQIEPENIVTYCDISKFTGNVYTKLGFRTTEKDITEPNYKWVTISTKKNAEILSRYQTQKHKLIEQGYGVYGDTEDEIMRNRGFAKIYDSGNLRLVWTSVDK